MFYLKSKSEKLLNILSNFVRRRDLFYVVEQANWVIRQVGLAVTKNLSNISSAILVTPTGIRNSIVHFGSVNTFLGPSSLFRAHRSNRIIVTWFHVVPGSSRNALVPKAVEQVDRWHTASFITRRELIDLGVPEKKITVIPLGVDLDVFFPASAQMKKEIRERLGIPRDRIVIGSFQKDGNGWGEGLEPKLIKGPDIFCDVVGRLSERFDLFILLTGPARGYVKRRLTQMNLPFSHSFFKNPNDVGDYYRALDLYLATARIEGGPQCVLESLASGVPLVTTRVGLAPDIITHGKNGMLCEVGNTEEIVACSSAILQDPSLAKKLTSCGTATAAGYSWNTVAQRYRRELYEPFL